MQHSSYCGNITPPPKKKKIYLNNLAYINVNVLNFYPAPHPSLILLFNSIITKVCEYNLLENELECSKKLHLTVTETGGEQTVDGSASQYRDWGKGSSYVRPEPTT